MNASSETTMLSKVESFSDSIPMNSPMTNQNDTGNEKDRGALLSEEVYQVPEGGRQAWMTLAGGYVSIHDYSRRKFSRRRTIMLFSTLGYVTSFGVYQGMYECGQCMLLTRL